MGECALFDGWRGCERGRHPPGNMNFCVLSALPLIQLTTLSTNHASFNAQNRDTTYQTGRETGTALTWFPWRAVRKAREVTCKYPPNAAAKSEDNWFVLAHSLSRISGIFMLRI